MERREYDLVSDVQSEHWFWQGRKCIIEAILNRYIEPGGRSHIADVGGGFGANIAMLRRYGRVAALEMDDDALARIAREHGDAVRLIKWKSPEPLEDRFDLMLLADVLEHIPDDAAAVDWMWNHLNPGGHVMITVPAHQFLWTEMDDVVHHFRRYSSPQLLGLFTGKFDLRVKGYYNMFLFPVKCAFVGFARAYRKMAPAREKRSYNEIPPRPVNATFKWALRLESLMIPHMSLPFGVSYVLLARRPA